MVDSDDKLRIAIVNPDRCNKGNIVKCALACKKTCPVNKTGKICIEVKQGSTICKIAENLCIGCGMCVKRCPFQAIKIINLPKGLASQVTHRYGMNSFKLHRLPTPRANEVLGLVGANGTGKSTALRVLSGNMRPNLGKYDDPPDWKTVLKFFRGNELQAFLTRLLEEDLKALIKIQYVDSVAKSKQVAKAIVGKKIRGMDKKDMADEVIEQLELESVLERQVDQLSGGELQRFICGLTCVQNVDIYMFDEPSSYLDVKQRLNAARMIRKMLAPQKYVIVVEHDLSVLDYLSDYICCLYGTPGAYGVVTMPFSVREGINIFLAGWVPTENMRFRDIELTFHTAGDSGADQIPDIGNMSEAEKKKEKERLANLNYAYPAMSKTLGPFHLEIDAGAFNASETIVMLGQNGTGKTTMIKMLGGFLKPDDAAIEMPRLNISMKPQTIAPKFEGTVQDLFNLKLKQTWSSNLFKTEVLVPLNIEELLDNEVQNLSGGELQRVAIVLSLAKPCDVYLIDEPSAYLDSEQRVLAARVMKRWIMAQKKAAFIVEHDFIMATYLADKVIVFSGIPAKESHCTAPQSMVSGMNQFLKMMDITFRRDPNNFRPRINKNNSQLDADQKRAGNYFLVETMSGAKIGQKEEDEEPQQEEEKKESKPEKKDKKKKKKRGDSDDD